MTFNTNQVVLDGFTQHDFVFTMFLDNAHSLSDTDILGRAVSLTSTAATVQLANNNDIIYGRIFQIEDRSQEGVLTVAVETKFRKRLKKQAGTTISIGDSVIGEGDGLVKAAAAADPTDNVVLDVASEYVIVETK